MTDMNRRSALSLALAATAVAAAIKPASAQAPSHRGEGISEQDWGKRDTTISGYKSVFMRDTIYQPGAKTGGGTMPHDMVCHVPEGELRVKQTDGMPFIAKKGDVWTCKKDSGEDVENVGSTVAIMRRILLIA